MTVGHDAQSSQEVLSDVTHWIWSCQLQIQRLLESTAQEFSSSQEQSRLERRRICSRTSYDEHMVLVALRNLLRSLDRGTAPLKKNLLRRSEDAIRHLRNIYEHWDEHRGVFRRGDPSEYERSLKVFLESFPEGRPWSTSYSPEGLVLGNVINIRDLLDDLESIETTATSILDWHE